jgi:hypothetical protein
MSIKASPQQMIIPAIFSLAIAAACGQLIRHLKSLYADFARSRDEL